MKQKRTKTMLHNQSGFTLIEMVMATAMVGFMSLMGWSVIAQISGNKRVAEDITNRNHELRVAMGYLVRDISLAYLSSNQNSSVDRSRTFFIGKDGFKTELNFSTLAHRPLQANVNESEQSIVSYYIAPSLNNDGKDNLFRKETIRLTNENWEDEPAFVDMIVANIESIKFEYWDWKNNVWKSTWDTTKSENEKDRLPSRVRIKIIPKEWLQKDVVYMSETRVFMEETLVFFN